MKKKEHQNCRLTAKDWHRQHVLNAALTQVETQAIMPDFDEHTLQRKIKATKKQNKNGNKHFKKYNVAALQEIQIFECLSYFYNI